MMRALLVLLALLVIPGTALAQAAGTIAVRPIASAPEPFDSTIAARIADELLRLGYQASSEEETDAFLTLVGKASAARTSAGAAFKISFVVTDSAGARLSAFTSDEIAPYDAQDPWDAFDADTLGRFAKKIALDTEKALKNIGSKGTTTAGIPAKNGEASLLGGTARIFIKGVSGAPGDGNLALANALAQFFAQFDIELLPASAADAYVVEAKVRVTPTDAGQDRVEILWLLQTIAGKEIARISQDNKVPRGSVQGSWGPVAIYAAEGAADGLLSVISQLGPEPPRR